MIHPSRRQDGGRKRVRTPNKTVGARLGERLDGRKRGPVGGATRHNLVTGGTGGCQDIGDPSMSEAWGIRLSGARGRAEDKIRSGGHGLET